MKLCPVCNSRPVEVYKTVTGVFKPFRYCIPCRDLVRSETVQIAKERYKEQRKRPNGDDDPVEKWQPKPRPILMTDSEQRKIDAKFLDNGPQDMGRTLTPAEIAKIAHTVTPVEQIPYERGWSLWAY